MSNVVQLPVSKPVEQAPEFISPSHLSSMSNEEIDALLEGIRTRRMDKATLHKETKKLRDKANSSNLLKQFDSKMEKLLKAIEATDKVIEKLEKAANEVRFIRMQLGENPL